MRLGLALTIVLAFATTSIAGEIKNGDTLQVKPNSIWFQDAAQLRKWQQFKKAGDTKALTRYQDKLLSEREAWQFLNPLTVKVLHFEPREHRVTVEMTSEGRMKGTTWSIDPDALASR